MREKGRPLVKRSARLLIMLLLPLLTAALLAACSDTPSQGGATATTGAIRIIPTSTVPAPEASVDQANTDPSKGPHFVIKSIPGKLEYDVKKITMKPGEIGQLTFKNDDPTQRHGFYIEQLILIPMDPRLGIEQLTDATVTIRGFDKPGQYEYYCGVPGHREAGMKGILEIVP
jgi:plastocyanin